MTRGAPILFGLLLLGPVAAPLPASERPTDDKKIVIRDEEVVPFEDDADGPLLQIERRHRAYIGVRPIEMTPDLRAHYGAPREAGVLVGEVEANGPAAKAGLQVGDIVTAADGERIESGSDLSRAIRRKNEGDAVKLDILRDKAKKTLSVSVAQRKGAETAWSEMGPRARERNFTFAMPEFEFRAPRHHDLDRLHDRLEEIEKRLKDLEKKLSAR